MDISRNLFDIKPDLIIETGTRYGGSALFLASILEVIGSGKVITIDIDNKEGRPKHDRITYVTGFSTDSRIFESVKKTADSCPVVIVILDSSHLTTHVYQEMNLFSDDKCYSY